MTTTKAQAFQRRERTAFVLSVTLAQVARAGLKLYARFEAGLETNDTGLRLLVYPNSYDLEWYKFLSSHAEPGRLAGWEHAQIEGDHLQQQRLRRLYYDVTTPEIRQAIDEGWKKLPAEQVEVDATLWCKVHEGESILTAPGGENVDWSQRYPQVWTNSTLTGVCIDGTSSVEYRVADILELSDGTAIATVSVDDPQYDADDDPRRNPDLLEESVTIIREHGSIAAL